MTDTQGYATVACANCNMMFAVTVEFEKRRRGDHGNFYCPAGHPQHWTDQTEEERLRKLAEYRASEMVRLRDELSRCERSRKRRKK